MSTELLDRLLSRRLGYVLTPWPRAVERTAESLARLAGMSTAEYLYQLLAAPDSDERTGRLVASATITHTAFFRHAEQFAYLKRVLPSIAAGSGGIVRIWSAGCSTGEEAYSVALAAAEVGVDVQILATDANIECLETARRGHYGAHRASGIPGVLPGQGWTAPESLKSRIRFGQSSLAGPGATLGMAPFHIVICRNVLIYFSPDGAERVVRSLLESLVRDGVLIVAPVEGLMRVPLSRPVDGPLGWFVATARPVSLRPPALVAERARKRRLSEATFKAVVPDAKPPPDDEQLLEDAARRLGDGDREGAEDVLRELLDTNPERAEAWFLLGEVLLHRNERVQARLCFSKSAGCAVNDRAIVEPKTFASAARRRAAMC